MQQESATRLPPLSDRTMLSLREGTLQILDEETPKEGYKVRGDLIRHIIEDWIATRRPADFKRLRGVEGVG